MGELAVAFAFAWRIGVACIGAGTAISFAVLVDRTTLGKAVHRLFLQIIDALDLFGCQEFAVFLVILLTKGEHLLTVVKLVFDGFFDLGIGHLRTVLLFLAVGAKCPKFFLIS